MKPVNQTLFGDTDGKLKGNCFPACLASILELPLEEIPHFYEGCEVDDFLANLKSLAKIEEFLNKQKYSYCVHFCEDFDSEEEFLKFIQTQTDSYWIAVGLPLMESDGEHHAVVYKNNKLLHDPHPPGLGLRSVENAWLLIKEKE